MALLWKGDVGVQQVFKTNCSIEVQISEGMGGKTWWLVCIYASTNRIMRRAQWEMLSSRKGLWGSDWMIAGDFNDIASQAEKWGGRTREEKSFHDF